MIFFKKYENKIIELLNELGFYNTDIINKRSGEIGRLKIIYYNTGPNVYDVRFFRYTKSGSLSKIPAYIPYSIYNGTDEAILQELSETFEVWRGDTNENQTKEAEKN